MAIRRTTALIAIAVLFSGCGNGDDSREGSINSSEPSADRPTSTNPPPTLDPPSRPPTTPSDPTPIDSFVGRVIEAGAGPCYTIETDDGRTYAVSSSGTVDLALGTTVRVKVDSANSTADCPGGQPVTASSIEIIQ